MKTICFTVLLTLYGWVAIGDIDQNDPAFIAAPAAPGGGGGLSIPNTWKNANNGNSLSVTVSPTAGNLLVVGIATHSGDEASQAVSDNIDSTTGWVKIAGVNNGGTRGSLWYKKNIPSGITTITLTGGSAGTDGHVGIVHEVSGASTSAPFTSGEYSTGASSGNSTYGPSGVTTATANSVLFALYYNHDFVDVSWTLNASGTDGTWSYADSTNSKELSGSSYIENASMPSIIVSSTGTRTHKWGGLDSGGYNTAIIAAFH